MPEGGENVDEPVSDGAHLVAFLEQAGWSIQGTAPRFEAKRTDELGLREHWSIQNILLGRRPGRSTT